MIAETQRLRVRPLNLADQRVLFDIYSDKDAMKYRGSKPFETLDDVAEMLSVTFQKLKTKEEFRYAVEHKESEELMGTFLIKPIAEQVCEIGYSIGKKYWGAGYGRELLKAMLDYIATLPFNTIVATSKKENIASLKLLESVGFQIFPEKEIHGCHFFEYLPKE